MELPVVGMQPRDRARQAEGRIDDAGAAQGGLAGQQAVLQAHPVGGQSQGKSDLVLGPRSDIAGRIEKGAGGILDRYAVDHVGELVVAQGHGGVSRAPEPPLIGRLVHPVLLWIKIGIAGVDRAGV